MSASVKASRRCGNVGANPKGLALTPIQTQDAGGCGASQRELALHRMPNFCVRCRARRQARTVRGAPWGRTGGDGCEHAARRREAAEVRAQQTAPRVGGGSCIVGTREALDKPSG